MCLIQIDDKFATTKSKGFQTIPLPPHYKVYFVYNFFLCNESFRKRLEMMIEFFSSSYLSNAFPHVRHKFDPIRFDVMMMMMADDDG